MSESPRAGERRPVGRGGWTRALLIALLVLSALPRWGFASRRPDPSKHWDERFNLTNIGVILGRGRYEPSNYFYGALSYLPQLAAFAGADALARHAGWTPLTVFDAEGGYTPFAYLLARGLQVLWGVLSILATFVLGRRLFGEEVGLLGAAILAATPRHLFSSSLFKPDVTLLLVSVVALGWILDCAARPTPGRHLLAGIGIGLATATKLNGAALAIPLAVITLAEPRERRRWAGLALAGIASIATFAVISPGFVGFLRDLGKNLAYYDRTAAGGRGEALRDVLGFFGGENFHGPVLGLAALAGFALFLRELGRRWRAPEGRAAGLELLAFVSFPPLYTLLYVVATPRAKANHFLQLLPWSSLAAALAIVVAARLAVERWPGLRRRLVEVVAVTAAGLVCLGAQAVSAYELSVPTTRTRALETLAAGLPADCVGCLAVVETDALPVETPPVVGARGIALRAVDDLSRLPARELAAADAHVFLRDRHPSAVEGGGGGDVQILGAAFLAAWGPPVVVAFHPWGSPTATPVPLALRWEKQVLVATGVVPAEIPDGSVVALRFRFRPAVRLRGWKAELRLGDEVVALSRAGARVKAVTLLTARFPLAERRFEIRGAARRKGGKARIEAEVLRWAPLPAG